MPGLITSLVESSRSGWWSHRVRHQNRL